MVDTPNLALPYLAASQAQKHVTVNEALRRLDALVQLSVLDRTNAEPPANPAEGSRYLVPAGASGGFAGKDHAIAAFQDGSWVFYTPRPGFLVQVQAENRLLVWSGAAWLSPQFAVPTLLPLLGLNATADAANRLALASPASLFNHEGAGHQIKVNKAAAGDTASLLFQTGFSGRAEFGLAGDDDLHLKVSPDGNIWREALVIEAASGDVALPFAQARPNLVINGAFAVNQRGFSGGALAAGAFGHDRWKAAPGGATYAVAGETMTLSTGAVQQVIDPASFGRPSFAGQSFTLSVDDPSTALAITFGSAAATLGAGPGRRGVTLTLGAAENGPITLRLAPAAGASSFARVRLEPGRQASRWQPRPAFEELALCRHFFRRMITRYFTCVDEAAASRNIGTLSLGPMRVTPAVTITSGGLTGQHALAPSLAAGPSAESLALAFTGAGYRPGVAGLGFVTLDLSAEI